MYPFVHRRSFKMNCRLLLLLPSIWMLLRLNCEGAALASRSTSSLTSDFISNLLSSFFPQHKLFILYGDFNSSTASRSKWRDNLEELIGNPWVISESGGVFHVKVHSNQTDFISIERTPKLLGEVGQVVLLLLPVGIPSKVEEKVLNQSLVLPLVGPPTVKNADKFILLTEGPYVGSLYKSRFFRRLKYKLALTKGQEGSLLIRQFCLHCPIQERIIVLQGLQDYPSMKYDEIFPDFQRNFYGYVLKASASDKMYGNLEFARDPQTGKLFAKRGIFASVLSHLSLGLNFSGEAFPSSGGGATGTLFPNGSWTGSVGDVYYGGATFCMLCSISLNRHLVIDMCSPVTYEYVTFAIGPPNKVYTWEAILWPFNAQLWLAIIGLTCFNILCSFIFLKWHLSEEGQHHHQSKWSILSIAQYFGRIFIEQGDILPGSLPQTIRIILGCWLLFALVGTTLYRGKMVSFMTFPVYEKTPSSFDELVESDYQIEFHFFPNIAYNTLKLSTNPVYRATFQRLIKEPDPVKCMAHTLSSKSVCIMFTSVHEDTINRNMSDQFGRSPVKAAPGYAFLYTPGIVLEKMSDVMPNFKWILQNSLERGLNKWWQRSDAMLLQKVRNAWVRRPENRRKAFKFDFEGDDVMRLKHLKGGFRVLFGGIFGAVLSFLMESIVKKKEKAKEILRKWKWKKGIKSGRKKSAEVLSLPAVAMHIRKSIHVISRIHPTPGAKEDSKEGGFTWTVH